MTHLTNHCRHMNINFKDFIAFSYAKSVKTYINSAGANICVTGCNVSCEADTNTVRKEEER